MTTDEDLSGPATADRAERYDSAKRPDAVLATHLTEVGTRQLYDIQTKAADGKVKNIGSYTAKVFGLETNKKEK